MAETLTSGRNISALPQSPKVFDSLKGRIAKGNRKGVSQVKKEEGSTSVSFLQKNGSHSPPISEVSTLKSEDSETDLRRLSSSASDLNFGESPCQKSAPGVGKCDSVVSTAVPSSDPFWALGAKMEPGGFPSENGKLYGIDDDSFYYDQIRDHDESSIDYGFDGIKLVKSESNFEEASCSEGMILIAGVDKTECDPGMHINSQHPSLFSWPDSALDFALESLDGEVHNMELLEDEKVLLDSITMGTDGNSERENTNAGSEDSLMEGFSKQGQEGDSLHSKRNKAPSSKRKVKVDWTPELHRRFVQAVEQLGVEKAIPSRILELMNVQCLTRHNIASHLQKYRSHRKHMMAREAETNSWNHRKSSSDPSSWPRLRRDGTAISTTSSPSFHTPIQPRPSYTPIQSQSSLQSQSSIQSQMQMQYPASQVVPPSQHQIGLPVQGMVPPHHHSQHSLPSAHPSFSPSLNPAHTLGMPMYVWGHPTVDHTPSHMWQQPSVPTCPPWFSTDGPALWHYPTASIDPWTPTQTVQGTPLYSPPLMRLPSASVVCGTPAPVVSTPVAPVSSNPTIMPSPSLQPFSVSEISLPPSLPPEIELSVKTTQNTPNPSEANLAKKQLEAAISDAMRNPWSLPLGLKSPPVDRVISDLKKQGIMTESIIMAS